ncbi:insulinase family protein [Anoxynatronum buryatiense]|uniref:Peptidase M16C associated domain-containing protein n=1 Tax=Anoxynatronum buryatiense TaxID=489973 RepID=A0AA46AHA8_9CLOT|nr:insulinase family protein [Anoxynatronum buryatiense]SMP37801.1 hypothetical protein SAMN06296020_10119 [Anoxynatronum buryatiense]
MNYSEGQELHGFRIVAITKVNEVEGTAYEMVHQKSGARLYYLQSEDDNKVFSISFRTPPGDSTGLPHILEHSVLCGSRKYPLKDPFVELAKGSMNTFLNAMTFSDKTMYPIASRNEKDFMNLMDVYLDAVFFPNLHDQPEILQQEGWHYEIKSKEEPLTIKGVVYNEMKGAFSSPEQILFRKIQETLFPDTPYGFESGGDPEIIPQLTQEMFTQFHQTYYHPSNSYLYLYGNGPIENHLALINEEYLSHFDRIFVDSAIPLQQPFVPEKNLLIEYPVASEESVIEKTYLSMNFVTGIATDSEHQLAMEMLNYLLLGTPAAPLKKSLIKEGLGKDVFGSYDSSIQQPVFSVIIKNSEADKLENFTKLVRKTLQELIDNGIDKKLIEAVINIHEFKLREADYGRYPKGLIYGMKIMESWLYDEVPSIHLAYEGPLQRVKEALTTPYFENLIRAMLLESKHYSTLILTPSPGMNEARETILSNQLEEMKKQMSSEMLDDLILKNQQLEKWQETAHTEEELTVMPLLTREDLQAEPEVIPTNVIPGYSSEVLIHDLFTNRIQYAGIYFDMAPLKQEELPYVGLLAALLGRISTENYSYEALSNELNLHTGGFYFKPDVYPNYSGKDDGVHRFIIRGKSLTEKNELFWHLLQEVLLRTRWDDRQRILEVIREIKSRLEMNLLHEGHLVASKRALAYFSPEAAFQEATSGLLFYHFIASLERDYNEQIDAVIATIQSVLKRILVQKGSMTSFTGEKKDFEAFSYEMEKFFSQLPNSSETVKPLALKCVNYQREGLYLSSKVQYVAQASNFKKFGHVYSGSMQVLKTICSLDYLWKRIRVAGGAYGAMTGLFRNGDAYFVSYRDPNLEETLRVYHDLAEYLERFDASHREMTKYIIGTMSRLDAPLTPSMKGEKADARYLAGLTVTDEHRERLEIIETGADTIRSYSHLIRQMIAENQYCIIGNENRIKGAAPLFDRMAQLID